MIVYEKFHPYLPHHNFWAILQWVLTVPLVLLWNFNGVVLAGILVSSTFIIPLRQVRKIVKIDIWPNVIPYLMYSFLTGLVVYLISRQVLIDSIWQLILVGGFGALFYAGLLFIFERKQMIRDIVRFKQVIFEKG